MVLKIEIGFCVRDLWTCQNGVLSKEWATFMTQTCDCLFNYILKKVVERCLILLKISWETTALRLNEPQDQYWSFKALMSVSSFCRSVWPVLSNCLQINMTISKSLWVPAQNLVTTICQTDSPKHTLKSVSMALPIVGLLESFLNTEYA